MKKKDRDSRMELREDGGVPYFIFKNLEETGMVRHGFSTRRGGVSQGHLASMNLSFTRGDEEERVRENFRRMGRAIGFEPEQLVLSDQTHTNHVRLVTEADRGKGYTRPLDYHDVDGMITDVPGLMLATFYADCVPLFFVDPVHRAIGLSHSGWKGTVQRIGAVTLQKMKEAFGTKPEDVQAAIGPSICQDCYEVSEDVAQAFTAEFKGAADERMLYRKPNGKYQLDLWRANEQVLLEAGVLPEHLEVTNVCTCCNPGLLFSHRASQGKRGNLGAFLMLMESPVETPEERFEFRSIRPEEAEQAARIEQICFPPNEACTEAMMKKRAAKAPELFLVAVDRKTGRMAGFLNGLSTDEEAFRDEFFTDAELYDPQGKQIMLLGLDVLPEYRGQGIARELMRRYMDREQEKGRKKLLLTCLESKVNMYESMGFQDLGISASAWGGETWHEMAADLEMTGQKPEGNL